MILGVLRENTEGERRIALVPEVVGRLVKAGHSVLVESGAGDKALQGLEQLSEEGAIQVFRQFNRTEDMLLGAVGQLQFEVFQYRMKAEYGAEVELVNLPYSHARWIEWSEDIGNLNYDHYSNIIVKDKDDRLVMLFQDEFSIRWVLEKNPGAQLHSISYGV